MVAAAKAAIPEIRETESTSEHIKATQPSPIMSEPVLNQQTFDCKASDRYNEHNFQIDVRNIF